MISSVGSLGAGVTTTTGSSHAFSPTAGQSTLGNTVICFCNLGGYDLSATTPIIDSLGNSWSVLTSSYLNSTGVAIMACTPTTALTTSTVITVKASNTGYSVGWQLWEFSGLTVTLDGTPTSGSGSANTPAVMSLTTSNPVDLVLAAWTEWGSTAPTFTPTVGWTGGSQAGSGTTSIYWLLWQFQIASTAGVKSTSGASSTLAATSTGIMAALEGQSVALQYARPSADAAAGGWTSTPGSPTTLFDKIDEASADDADYISATAT